MRRTTVPITVPLAVLAVTVTAILAGCGAPGDEAWTSPMAFDTTTAWLTTGSDGSDGSDSVSLLVEVAANDEQRAFGLSRRPDLDPGSGMLFEFDEAQDPEHGFWMWRTNVPLDIAFLDASGEIVRILQMDVCGGRMESCPTHAPGVGYSSALEANLGWFAEHGVREGSRVRIER